MGTIYTATADIITRPADTTQYGINDVVGVNLAVTGATNATPIVITTAAHGLATGDVVTIASVGGNTNANSTFKVTVLSTTTFSLDGSSGNAAYTSGGTVAQWLRIPNAARPGGGGIIRGWKLSTNNNATTNAQFSLLVAKGSTTGYQLPPAATLDNVIPAISYYTERDLIVGKLSTVTIGASTLGASSGLGYVGSLSVPYDLLGTGTDLYCAIIAEAAYTPASAQTIAVAVDVEKY
jgi:hypothetical protein